jgi:hypothetical protein
MGSPSNPGRFSRAVMQMDGNYVVYASGGASFASGTAGNPGARLLLSDTGFLKLFRTNGTVVWSRP